MLRNYDIIKGIVRRYVGEYIKSPHDFIVGANNPEVVFAKDAKLAQEIMMIAEQAVAQKIQQTYQEFLGQGGDPNQFNVQEQVDIEGFIKEFNEKCRENVWKNEKSFREFTDLMGQFIDLDNPYVTYDNGKTFEERKPDNRYEKIGY